MYIKSCQWNCFHNLAKKDAIGFHKKEFAGFNFAIGSKQKKIAEFNSAILVQNCRNRFRENIFRKNFFPKKFFP